MSDADLIYNACLRAERSLEERIEKLNATPETAFYVQVGLIAIKTLREEIGNGLASEGR